MQLDRFFERLWQDYLAMTPSAQRIKELLEARGEVMVNDHIALRTFDHPQVCLARLAEPFLDWGYREAPDHYEFPVKKLRARHFEHPQGLPKIFISELMLNEFTPELQLIVAQCFESLPKHVAAIDLYLEGAPWRLRCAEYQSLVDQSEYAAWVCAHGYRPNHFTVSVNHLSTFDDLAALNGFLVAQGFRLNEAGGVIKGSAEVGLEQSSTLADSTEVGFADGSMRIPSCYYEFAQRHARDADNPDQLYQGFVTASADRIFESTNREPG